MVLGPRRSLDPETETHMVKVAGFIREMESRGLSAFDVAPLAFRHLWRLGAKIPPPYFLKWYQILLFGGFGFAVPFGVFLWFARNARPDITFGKILIVAAVCGLLFGLVMAIYLRRKARALGLPNWANYQAALDDWPKARDEGY